MASPFSQYRGGIKPVEGIQQAGANIAKYTYEGLATAGSNLAEGIKAYQTNIAQNEQATEELNQIGQALIKQKQMFGDNPEFAEFGARLDPLIDSVSGAPTKSLSQKLAILNNAKAVIGTTGADFQMYQTLKNAKAQQEMQTAQAGLPTTETIQGGAFLQDGSYIYNPNQDAAANDQQFLGAINQMRKLSESRGEKFTVDTASALRNYHKNTILGVQKAQAAGQISAEQAAITIEQLQNADKNLDRKEIQDSGLAYYEDVGATPTQSSLAQYATEKSLATPVAQSVAEQKAQKLESTQSQTEQKQGRQEQVNKALKDAKLNDLATERASYNRIITNSNVEINKLNEEAKNITPFVKESDSLVMRASAGTGMGGQVMGRRNKTAKEITEQSNAIEKRIKELEDAKKKATSGLSTLESREEKIKSGIDTSTVEKQPIKTEELPSTAGVGEIFAGKREAVVPISIEDKKQKLQAHFQKSWGYVPSNFDAIFKSLNPEANLQVVDTKWGPMQWDGKQWNQLDMNKAGYGKALTTAQQREAVRGVFGQQRQDGSYVPAEIVKGSGIKVGGLFSGTDEELKVFKTDLAHAGPALRDIERLKEINDRVGEWADFEAKGEADVLVNSLAGAMRTSIVGPGAVSVAEWDLIKKVIADPTAFFSMESRDRGSLIKLGIRVKESLQNQAMVNGLTISIEGDKRETEKNLRANRLLTK